MRISTILAASALLIASADANAAILFAAAPATPEQATPGVLSVNFAASTGAGSAAFDIIGYRTLDGVGGFTDTFTLALNGVDLFAGAFDLGGGGVNTIFFQPAGATATATSSGLNLGGIANVFVPLMLSAGNNTLTFTYSGGAQGINDEAWGLQNIVVNGVAVVPEPAQWTLLIAGFGLVGAMARRRRPAVVA